jgi:peroxiredoxin Q/BCP
LAGRPASFPLAKRRSGATGPAMSRRRLFTCLAMFSCNAGAEPLELGAAIPAVAATGQDGAKIELAEAGKSGWVLVYFYPKADTPGCTKQACSLRDSWAELQKKGVKVFGVSLDGVEAQKAFRDKYELPFTLLADEDGKVADAFGVPHAGGFAKRQAFLFKDGKLSWRDLSAATAKQAADVLAELE